MNLLKIIKKKCDLTDIIHAKEEKTITEGSIVEDVKLLKEEDVSDKFFDYPEIASLTDYNETKNEIIQLINNVILLIKKHELPTSIYNEILSKLNSEFFNIVVLGEFSRGKSTFINALIGKKILPSNILPTTSVLTKIVYSEVSKVDIIKKDKSVCSISVENLQKYVTSLSNHSKDLSSQVIEAIVALPLSLLQNNCIITDTPGVNDINQQNVEITYNCLPTADAVILLLDPDQPFSESDRLFLQNKIMAQDITKIFFVLNKSDLLKQTVIANTEAHIRNRIKACTNINNMKLYSISSKKTLLSKMKALSDEFENDFNELEKDLSQFLSVEKGRVIIQNVSLRAISHLEKSILALNILHNNLESPLNEISDKHKCFIEIKTKLTTEKNEVFQVLERKKNDFKVFLSTEILTDIQNIFESLINNDALNIINDIELALKNWFETKLQTQIKNFYLESYHLAENLHEELSKSINTLTEFWVTQENNAPILLEDSQQSFVNIDEPRHIGIASGIGVGVFAYFVTLSLPITILASIVGGSYIKRFLEIKQHNLNEQKKKDLLNQVYVIAQNIENEVSIRIDKQMEVINSRVNDFFNSNFDNIENSMRCLLEQKKSKLQEVSLIRKDINKTLSDLYTIKKQLQNIFKSVSREK